LENLEESLNYFTEGDMHNRLKEDYEKCLKFKEAYENNDRDLISDSMISVINENQEQAIGFMGYSDGGFPLETIKINISEISEVKERNVETPLPYAYEVKSTPFDKFRIMSDYIRYMNYSKRYQPSITYIINEIFKNGLNYLMLSIFVIALATGFTSEQEGNNTIRLMNIQPIKSREIYLGKLLAQIVVFISIILLSLGIVFAGLLFSGKKIEANYPAIHYENKMDNDYEADKLLRKNLAINKGQDSIKIDDHKTFIGYRFRNMSKENVEMITTFIIIVIMILSFSMLISLGIKSRWQTSIITILVFILGYGFSTQVLKGLSLFLPFIWIAQALVSSGEANIIFDTNLIDIKTGIIILALWIVVAVFFGIKKYNKKYGRC
jgi:ABC-type transport system involved in multi-copper enzyme maturation permease subunit